MIKVPGLGGEVGIPRNQIQSITSGSANVPSLRLADIESKSQKTSDSSGNSTGISSKVSPIPITSDGVNDKSHVEEEKEYKRKLAEVTQKLEAAKEQYIKATQGGGTASNVSKDGLKAWTMDLASRIHDSQKLPNGGGPSSTPPTPPYAPNYTSKEKELSELRVQIDNLQIEQNNLVEEMKSKNFLR